MQETSQTEIKSANKQKWLRLIYMVIFMITGSIAVSLASLIAFFQFIAILVSDKSNENLLALGKMLGLYIKQIVEYLTYNTEEKPYPFSAWPTEKK